MKKTLNISCRLKRELKVLFYSVISSCFIGSGIGILINNDPFSGLFIALFISTVSSVGDYWLNGIPAVRRMRLIFVILIHSVFYFTVIAVPILIWGVYVKGASLSEVVKLHVIWFGVGISLFLILLYQFIYNISNIIGRRVLVNLVRGKYHKPREETRIFMFLDLNGSTTLAEKIGHVKFHSFLNDFFYLISEPILRSKGDVYKYVGDEVIVTWEPGRGIKDLNCVRCFFGIQKAIHSAQEDFLRKYGELPSFSAGLHSGLVTVGEMGLIKLEIAYLGDTVNTAARILTEAKSRKIPVAVSQELVKILPAHPGYTFTTIGNIILRGKTQELELYRADENQTAENTI